MARQPRQGAPDYQRLLARIEDGDAAIAERFEAAFERILDGIQKLREEVQQGRLEGDALARTVGDLETQMINTREELQRYRSTQALVTTQAAAKGAAEGAAAGTAQLKATVHAGFFATWKGWAVSGLVGIAALSGGVEGIPKIVKFFSGLFRYLEGVK